MPVRSDIPAYDMQVELESRLYNMTVRYDTRMSRWILDIYDENSSPIIVGVPILTKIPLLRRFKDTRLPPGDLIALDESGEDKQAARDDLGNDVKLFYVESV